MDARSRFARLFEFDAWANRELLAVLERDPGVPGRALERFAHVLGAGRLWFDRLHSRESPVAVWPSPALEFCASESRAQARDWPAYLETLGDAAFSRTIEYVNTRGEPWSSSVEDVLEHVVMHAHYHRGQIASDLRSAKIAPPFLDFIHAVRSKAID